MPEINNYMFSHKELLELLVRKAGVKEGRWVLSMTFGLAPGNFGPTENDLSPGIAVGITSVGIQREAPPSSAPRALVIDASTLEPHQEAPKSEKLHRAKGSSV